MNRKLSVVLVTYNMARELPRTLRSLSPRYQRDIEADDYEVVVVDNGSHDDTYLDALYDALPNLQIHRMAEPTQSPVPAINRGLDLASGDLVGVCIDGARMVSPRLLAGAREAAACHPRPVVGTLAFHLGPAVQSVSVHHGYDQAAEDALLRSVDWHEDGYRLFSISVFASSSAAGWFATPQETNALFLKREHWRELGGFDPAFRAAGGGLANLDIWQRLCADPHAQAMLLLGEATFHQFHGGVATNALDSPWQEFHDEYVSVRGHAFPRVTRELLLVGRFNPASWPSIRTSVDLVLPPQKRSG